MTSSHSIVMQELEVNRPETTKPDEFKKTKDSFDEEYWLTLLATPKEYTLHRTAEQAEAARAGKKDIYSKETKETFFRFAVMGCSGKNSDEAKEVGRLIAELKNIFCLLDTGDAFYDDGLLKRHDPRMEEYYKKYEKFLENNFVIAAFGNHDHGQRFSFGLVNKSPSKEEQAKRAAYQVEHTFCSSKITSGKTEYFLDMEKVKYLQEEHIDKETLIKKGIKRLCPSACCVYNIPEGNLEVFTVDTSTLLLDYLNIHDNLKKLIEVRSMRQQEIIKIRQEEKNNKKGQDEYFQLEQEIIFLTERLKNEEPKQAKWFIERIKKNHDTIKVISQHHPYHSSAGKDHISLYLNSQEVKFVQELIGIKGSVSVNELLEKMAIKESIQSDVLVHSDDHHLGYYKNQHICQVNAGGGGGQLHSRNDFSEIKQSPFFLKEHGCVSFDVSSKMKDSPVLIHFHSVSGKTWHFTNKNLDPVYDWKNIPNETHQLFYINIKEVVMKVCCQFLTENTREEKASDISYMFYAKKTLKNFIHDENTDCAISTLNFLLYPQPLSLFQFVKTLAEMLVPKLLQRINLALASVTFTINDNSFSVTNLNELISACEKYIKTPLEVSEAEMQGEFTEESWQLISESIGSESDLVVPRSPTSCRA